MKRPAKKSETLEVRLPYEQKNAFMAACRAEGMTASHAIRRFIERAVGGDGERPGGALFGRHRRKTGVAAATLGAGLMAFGAAPGVAGGSTFDRLDRDRDGKVTASEISSGDTDSDRRAAALVAALDFSGDDMLSREELPGSKGSVVVDSDERRVLAGRDVRTLEVRHARYDFSDPENTDITVIRRSRTVDADIAESEAMRILAALRADVMTQASAEAAPSEA